MLRLQQEIADRATGPGPAHWALLITASTLGEWGAVRRTATLLGMNVPGTGPIDEAWGEVHLAFQKRQGPRR